MGRDVPYQVNRRTSTTGDELDRLRGHTLREGGEVSAVLIEGECPTCEHRTRQIASLTVLTEEPPAPRGSTPTATDSASVERLQTVSDDTKQGRLGLQPSTADEVANDRRRQVKARQRSTAPALAHAPVVLTCQCASEHLDAGGEAEHFGCGTSWMIRAVFDPAVIEPIEIHQATEIDKSYWQTVDEVEKSSADVLTKVRASAVTWTKTLAAIMGLVGITAAFAGRDVVMKMDDGYAAALALGVAIFFVLSAITMYFAQQASTGFPRLKPVYTRMDLDSYVQDATHQGFNSVTWLRLTKSMTGLVFAWSVVLLLVLLLAPDDAPATPDPQVSVTLKNSRGTFQCVTLQESDDPTKVVIKAEGDPVKSYPLRSIASIGPGVC